MKEKEKLFFIPLGGCSEIGMNMYVYGYDNGKEVDYILVDAGVTCLLYTSPSPRD